VANKRTPDQVKQDKIEGAWLAHWRHRAGKSQEALAEAVGVSLRSIQQWERGLVHMRNDRVVALTAALDVDFTEIRRTNGGAKELPPTAEVARAKANQAKRRR
jgi:transcriptional regulator with XRE-family HTH domain